MSDARTGIGHRRRAGWLKPVGFSALMAIGATWLAILYEHPVDDSIVQAMSDPRCEVVRRMPAGALLAVSPPDDDRCVSFYMYRVVSMHTADDEQTYVASVGQERIAQFWQLVRPVMALWAVSVGVFAGSLWLARRLLGRRG
ncbi:hypothetical protein WKR88_00130 [Trinickia caryophylli]|nr:hypothetical protein [Trinickia caryophylli]PMS13530.1 hypothetical protein C0Z17_04400 [Trinickia caryophylli]TRX13608.1 hypothetical protein FNF07_19565 [Trinickia caryophylli]WQE15186.1 hypothetical protein U0034_21800 [Trinickia caryophylli]GLU31074.1 hypothetical protein Busp01_09160 [Trinickia caryophylli]